MREHLRSQLISLLLAVHPFSHRPNNWIGSSKPEPVAEAPGETCANAVTRPWRTRELPRIIGQWPAAGAIDFAPPALPHCCILCLTSRQCLFSILLNAGSSIARFSWEKSRTASEREKREKERTVFSLCFHSIRWFLKFAPRIICSTVLPTREYSAGLIRFPSDERSEIRWGFAMFCRI